MKSVKTAFCYLLAGMALSGCSAVAKAGAPSATAADTPVPATAKLEFIGHSSFLITASDGTRIVTDPYRDYVAPQEIQLYPKGIAADAVVITHFHADHSNWQAIQSDRLIYETGSYTVGVVKLTGYAGDHGFLNGEPNGANTVWVFKIGELKIVDTGANGVITEPDILAAIADADVVIMRAAGDAGHPLKEMVAQLRERKARTLIPSHNSISEKNRFFSAYTIEEFLAELGSGETVVRKDGSELDVADGMPVQVVVLTPSALASQ